MLSVCLASSTIQLLLLVMIVIVRLTGEKMPTARIPRRSHWSSGVTGFPSVRENYLESNCTTGSWGGGVISKFTVYTIDVKRFTFLFFFHKNAFLTFSILSRFFLLLKQRKYWRTCMLFECHELSIHANILFQYLQYWKSLALVKLQCYSFS